MQRRRADRSTFPRRKPVYDPHLMQRPPSSDRMDGESRFRPTGRWQEPINLFTRVIPDPMHAYGNGNPESSRLYSQRAKAMWDRYFMAAELEAEQWVVNEQARQMDVLRERMRANRQPDDIRRARMEEDWRREADRRSQYEAQRQRMEKEKRGMNEMRGFSQDDMLTAWKKYEEVWDTFKPVQTDSAAEEPELLTFENVPWPMCGTPDKPEAITPARVAAFLLSTVHSPNVSRKDRIRQALRRWHPDRFKRVLNRVSETDKARIEEGAEIVVRILNDLMAREGKLSSFRRDDPGSTREG